MNRPPNPDPPSPVATPQRYDLVTHYRCGSAIEEMDKSDDGEWVRFEDVAEAVALFAEEERRRQCICDGGEQGEGCVSIPHEPHCPLRELR